MKSLLKHLGVFRLAWADMFIDRGRGTIYFFISFINAVVYFQVWKSAGVHTIHGVDLVSYYFLLMVVGTFVFAHVETPIAYVDIQEGNLSSLLTKPYSYGMYRLWTEVPWRLFQGIIGIGLLLMMVTVFQVPIHIETEPFGMILTIVSIVFGFCIMFLYKTILGLAAFWMTEILGLTQTSDVILLMLGGYIMPIAAFPPWLSTIAWISPFPYVAYVPVLFSGGMVQNDQMSSMLFGQCLWILILGITTVIVWRRGVKLYVGMGE
jgi:ABC-2 type transport system permease protein